MARDVRVVIEGNADSLLRATAEAGLALKALDSTGSRTGSSLSSKLGTAFKIIAPAAIGAGLAILQLTGNMGALLPILPALTTAIGVLLIPFTSLAAVAVALVGPVVLLTGLLGLLGGAFFLAGLHGLKNGLAPQLAALMGQFHQLEQTLTARFMPVFRFLISSASEALTYFEKIAKLPLAQAFKSLSTTGVAGITKFLEQIGHLVANPIRLAFQFAFGGGGQNVNNALGKLWNQVVAFFTKAPPGGQSISGMIAAWFGRHDFTKTGARWGQELASGIMAALGAALRKALTSRTAIGIAGGAMIGAIVGAFTPAGPLIGAALGAGIGAVLGHYWPRIVAAAKHAWAELPIGVKKDLLAIGKDIGTIARDFIAIGRDIIQLGEKTGLWHALLRLAEGTAVLIIHAVRLVADAVTKVIGLVRNLFDWFTRNKTAVGLISSAVHGISTAVSTVIGWVQKLVHMVGTELGQAVGGVRTAVGGIGTAFSAAKSAAGRVLSVLESIGRFLSHPLSLSISFPSPPSWLTNFLGGGAPGPSLNRQTGQYGRIPGRGYASGGAIGAGEWGWVGEHGPELLHMGSHGGFITPNHALGGTTIIVQGSIIDTDGLIRAMQTATLRGARRGFKLSGPGGTG